MITIYNRKKKSKDYNKKLIPICIMKDRKLNAQEIGLIVYLLSNADSFVINKENVIKEFIKRGDSRNSIENAWKNLYQLKYLQCNRLGKGKGIQWIVNELPENL